MLYKYKNPMSKNNFRKDFSRGLAAFTGVLAFVSQHKMWKFFVVPALLTLLLFGGVFFGAWTLSPKLVGWLGDVTNYEDMNFKGAGKLIQLINALLSVVLFILVLLPFYYLYKIIILTLLSPFLSYVSEKTEFYLTGNKYDFSWNQMGKDVLRGLRLTGRNLSREIPLTLLFIVLAFVPIIGIISPILIFINSAYFAGMGLMDPFFERRKKNVKETVVSIRQQRGYALACGAVFNLLIFIPIIGILTAPLIAVIGTTIGLVKREVGVNLPTNKDV